VLNFKDFIYERKVDPVDLGTRTSSLFGKKTSFGKWEKVKKGGHIPLTSFNARKSNAAGDKLWKVQKHFDFDSRVKEVRELGRIKYDTVRETKKLNIKDLVATQPFVRTDDVEKLKLKVAETKPDHIHVVRHKGVDYIEDGHHAVMAAKLRGEKQVSARFIDLDQFK